MSFVVKLRDQLGNKVSIHGGMADCRQKKQCRKTQGQNDNDMAFHGAA